MANNQPTTNDNDFFKLLADEQQAREGSAADQIVFRDADGKMKVLKDGQVFDYDQNSGNIVRPLLPKPVPAETVTAKSAPAARPAAISRRVLPPVLPAGGLPPSAMPIPVAENLDNQVRSVIGRSGVKIGTEDDLRRFKNIIVSGLRNIRDRVELTEALTNQPLNGGMGLPEAQAQKIIDQIRQEIETPAVPIPPMPAKEPVMAAKPPEPVMTEIKPIIPTPAKVEPARPQAKPAFPPPPKPAAANTAEAKFSALQKEASSILASQEAVPPPKQIVADVIKPKPYLPVVAEAKPKIEEVKYRPTLVGPVEEIRLMKLADFRKLAPVPAEAAKKILEKIERLEAESFAQRHEAIKAWRENEITRLYMELGEQAMEEKKPISAVIEERTQARQQTLTEAELEAVIALNQKLRY